MLVRKFLEEFLPKKKISVSSKILEKIILGTASLGMKYGINALTELSVDEVDNILSLASKSGIHCLDTALDYGQAHDRIRSFEEKNNIKFEIISKVKCENKEALESSLRECLTSLGRTTLNAFLFHRFSDFLKDDCRHFLADRCSKGVVSLVGVSIYSKDELRRVIHEFSDEISIIQIPFNILDKDDEKCQLLTQAKSLGIQIHARSVFLQGLLLKDMALYWGELESLKEPIKKIRGYVETSAVTMQALCLQYVVSRPFIDKVIMGVNGYSELEQNIQNLSLVIPNELIRKVDRMHCEEAKYLDPRNWNA
jgi:aryl-alcohol dehydrogenase-like predicted oxidoreductase